MRCTERSLRRVVGSAVSTGSMFVFIKGRLVFPFNVTK